ncbi:hypothetical protein OC835_000434 [Tilletia horrida]|nr:hypothetical protein OC835_000434 [Tilletia horrida]
MESKTVLILGGGVIGLSTGIVLLEDAQKRGETLKVVLAAEHLPRTVPRQLSTEESQTGLQCDLKAYPASYASVWAGAHHVTDTAAPFMGGIVKQTYERMVELEKEFASAQPSYSPAPLFWVEQVEHFSEETKPGEPLPWEGLFDYYPDFRVLEKTPHSAHSCAFRTLDIDTRTYLPFLLARFLELGGQALHVSRFTSIASALSAPEVRTALGPASLRPDAIVVATGHSLPKDDEPTEAEREEARKDYTLRGQVLRIRAPWRSNVGVSRVNAEGFRDLYVLPFSDGTFVVGGTRVPDDVDPNPQEHVTDAILSRVLPIVPDLRTPDASPGSPLREQVDIFAVGVGLRPSRQGGPRIELDGSGLEGTPVVWCYGFGGTGYQSSWGSAMHVSKLLSLEQ